MLPFTSYDNLVANVQETLNRADLASAIPGFVALVEGEVNADDRFRILPSLVRATAVILPVLSPPAISSIAASTTGGTLAAGTYFYVATWMNANGETLASNELSVTTTGSTSSVSFNLTAPPAGTASGRVYRGTQAGQENQFYAIGSTASGTSPGVVTTFTDTGAAATAGSPPTTVPAIASFIPVPQDYIAMQDFRILGVPPPGRLDVLTTSQMNDQRMILPEQDLPKFYSVIGREMELLPAPDITYNVQMVYYSEIPPLGDAPGQNQTNWLLELYPNIYYYGALMQAAPYLKDDGRIAVWSGLYERLADKIEVANGRAQFSGAPMRMRVNKGYR